MRDSNRECPAGPSLDRILTLALEEDRGPRDLTTENLIGDDRRARGRLVAKAPGVFAGGPVFRRVFELLDQGVVTRIHCEEGAPVEAGSVLLELEGTACALLIGERTALNFVQRLAGIATLTRRFVDLAAGHAAILDTRKTTPLLRVFEKYAVLCGGGRNHRFGLFDEAMIKDNHIDASGFTLSEILQRLRESCGPDVIITAEARDESEALCAVEGGADVVLLDNMTAAGLRELCPRLRTAAEDRERPLELEASGGVDLGTVAEIAASGVDRVSVGCLTHSAPALDLSLELEFLP